VVYVVGRFSMWLIVVDVADRGLKSVSTY